MTDDPEDRDPGLARERTALSWTRTAIGFAALGGVILKTNVVPGIIVIAISPVVWRLGQLSRSGATVPGRLRLITATIVAVSLVALVLSFVASSRGPRLP
jgi:uncharacterized membrane protein YidH (DUF202 family)